MENSVKKENGSFLDKVMGIKIGYFPLPVYLIMTLILVVSYFTGKFQSNLFSAVLVCCVYACGCLFIVEKIPGVRKLGMTVVMFMIPALGLIGLLPDSFKESVSSFYTGEMGFQTCYIISIICGSILTMDRKMLIKTGIRYFVPVIGGLVCSFVLSGVLGSILGGMSFKEVILYIASPIMGGGNGAGAVPMSQIYSGYLGVDQKEVYSKIFAWISIGQWVSLALAVILTALGKKFPKLTGSQGGGLMKGDESIELKKIEYGFDYDFSDVMVGVAVVASVFLFGRICNKFISSLHAYVFSIVIVIVIKIAGILPKRVEYGVSILYNKFIKKITVISLGAVAISMFDLTELVSILNLKNIIIATGVVLGGVIGAWVFGRIVGFYPIESSITAGLCMSNAGGNGDIIILTACDRMDLMPYAQVSSRIGGAIVLALASVLASLWLA